MHGVSASDPLTRPRKLRADTPLGKGTKGRMAPSILSATPTDPSSSVVLEVAILCPLGRDRRFIADMPESSMGKRKYNFHFLDSNLSYANRDLTCSFDMCAYVQECAAYVEEKGIDAVLATRDVADLILAAIVQELDGKKKIMVPSITSVFLALHKIRTREVLDPNPIYFEAVNVHNLPQRKDLLSRFVKPSTGSCSQATFHLKNEHSLLHASQTLKKELPQFSTYLDPFLRKYLPLDELVEAERLDCRQFALAEEFVAAWLIVTVDGYVDLNGNIHMWVVSDNNYHRAKTASFSDLTIPSKLYKDRPSVINKLEEAYIEIGKRLVSHGFRASFYNVEFFVNINPEERVSVMEVNGRMATQATEIYRKVLDVDHYIVKTELCLGLQPGVAKFDMKLNHLVGSNVYVNIFIGDDEEGIAASEIIDFEEVDKIKSESSASLEMKCKPSSLLAKSNNCGTTVAMMDLISETSRGVNMSRAIKLQKRFLKRPELAPWHPNFKYKD